MKTVGAGGDSLDPAVSGFGAPMVPVRIPLRRIARTFGEKLMSSEKANRSELARAERASDPLPGPTIGLPRNFECDVIFPASGC